MVTQALDSGITVILGTGTPQTAGSMVPYNDTVWAIATQYGLRVSDNYTVLVASSGTDMDSKYYSDGIHFNQLGNNALAGTFKSALAPYVEYGSHVIIKSPPLNNKPLYLASYDSTGGLTKTFAGTDTSYVRTLPDGAISTDGQPGGLHLTKESAITAPVRLGGTYASPYLSVDGFGLTTVTSLLSKGLYTYAGGMELGNASNPNVFTWDFRSYQRPWKITFNYPAIAVYGMILNADNEGGNLPSNYKFLLGQNNGTEKWNINRGGGFRGDTTSGYTHNINSLIGTNDFPTKGLVDSLIAAAVTGGADLSIYTKQQDTISLATFTAGSGADGDTAAFSTSAIYGSFYNDGSDTLIITSLRGVLQGTSPSVTYKVFYNDSINVESGASALVTAGTALTNTATGAAVTSFDNTKIPPGVWVWVKTSTVTTKPKYFSLSLIGYKKRK
jgi:hypothetical protein